MTRTWLLQVFDPADEVRFAKAVLTREFAQRVLRLRKLLAFEPEFRGVTEFRLECPIEVEFALCEDMPAELDELVADKCAIPLSDEQLAELSGRRWERTSSAYQAAVVCLHGVYFVEQYDDAGTPDAATAFIKFECLEAML